MNLKTAFDAENAEITQSTQSFSENVPLTRLVNVDFPSAPSASLRPLR